MMHHAPKALLLFASLVPMAVLAAAPIAAPPVTVTIDTPMPAPAWATLERRLLAENVPACREFYEKYYDARGYVQCFLRWGANDGPDDAFENFNHWPELHALGADDEILKRYLAAFEGMTRQYSEAKTTDVAAGRDGMYVKEYLRAVGLDASRRGAAALQPHGAVGAHAAGLSRARAPVRRLLHG